MTPLSVVIITFNEEKNIDRCITSVKDIADEIVVVDSFSTDKTPEICKKHKVKFIQHKFDGYTEQKNLANAKAKFPLVFSLDADEAPDETLKNEITHLKENPDAQGYSMNRLTNYCGKWIRHSGWYPDKKLRLWDIRHGEWSGSYIHEKVSMRDGAVIRHLKGNILHYSYYTISDHIKQVDKFTEIGATAAYTKGKRVNIVSILVSPAWKFFRDYFIRMGFLDGYYGFVISMISAHATFLKYAKIKELQKKP